MTLGILLKECSARSIELRPDGDKLRVKAPVGVVTGELRNELVRHKPAILKMLRWDPLVPRGWIASAWAGRLEYMSRNCMHADRGQELGQWAATVREVHGLDEDMDTDGFDD